MKKIIQTRFGKSKGNCFAACVASILEVPFDDELQNLLAVQDTDWFFAAQVAIRKYGVSLLCVHFAKHSDTAIHTKDCHYIVSGPGPRGCNHACVGLNGHIVHDPHPDDSGLSGEIIDYIYLIRV